jgi:hypothetical protein
MVSGSRSSRVFLNQKLRFLEKTFITPTQRKISRRVFWLVWKNSYFFRLAVNRKKALTKSGTELEQKNASVDGPLHAVSTIKILFPTYLSLDLKKPMDKFFFWSFIWQF